MHQVAFQLGPLTIHWYGVFVALGFLVGFWTASRRAPREGLTPESILDLGPWLILGTLLGARGLYVATHWERFAAKPFPEVFMIHHGGLVYYGGLIGAIAAVWGYLIYKKMPIWRVGDVMAPSIALGSFFG